MRRHTAIITLALLALVPSSSERPASENAERVGKIPFTFLHLWYSQADTLSGLEGIYVGVILDDEARQLGLSEQTLKNAIELRLRKDGISTISEKEYDKPPIFRRKIHDFVAEGYLGVKRAKYTEEMKDYGYLQFAVTATSIDYPIAANVKVTLTQSALLPALLPDQIMFTPCITWIDGSTGAYGASAFREEIPKTIDELADRFCKDYVAAHQKQGGETKTQ